MNPVLVLHGALGCSDQLKPLKQALVSQGREVMELNFSGHGGAPFQSDFGIEQFAVESANFLANQKVNTVDIFGYSMGGYVACWLAHTQPNLVNKIVTLGTKFDWSPDSARKEVTKMDPEKIATKVPHFARMLESRHAPNDWKLLMTRTAEMMIKLGNNPLLTEAILRSIKSETIIALGDLDDMADRAYSELVSSWMPGASFKLLTNTQHPIEKVELPSIIRLLTKVK
jgi:esterase/lipase